VLCTCIRAGALARIGLLTGLAVGCGSSRGGLPELAGSVITVKTGRPPALIAFRDDATVDWQTLTLDGASVFDIAVVGPYRVVIVCQSSGFVASVGVTEYARTPDDETTIDRPCGTGVYPFDVHGTMAESGLVSFGNFGTGTTSALWEFDLRSEPGSFDLVALFGDFSAAYTDIAIRRGVKVSGDTEVGTLDRSTDSVVPLVSASFTATNPLPGESMYGAVTFDTGSTAALLTNRSTPEPDRWAATLVPDALLRPTDHQKMQLSGTRPQDSAATQSSTRGLTRAVRAGDPRSITLPEPLGPVTFDMSTFRLDARWSTLPDHDVITLMRESFGERLANDVFHEVVATRRFVEATGASSVVLDFRDVPGFHREWHHDPTFDQVRSLSVSRPMSATESVFSTISEAIPSLTATRPLPAAGRDARPPRIGKVPGWRTRTTPLLPSELDLAGRW
jgi:hypothetical protein